MTPPNATSLTAIRRIRPYALAVGAVAAALGLALVAELQSVDHLETSLFLIAIAVAVWYAGPGPGALAMVLASLCFNYFFTNPRYSLDLEPVDRIHLVIFVLFALLIGWFADKRRRIEQELRRALDELNTTAQRTQQASLLNLTHDTIFVRDMSDVITYWNRGAEEFYGWTAEEVVGKVTSHQLLHTVFPAAREKINADLLRTGRWEGELVHTKRDGTQVVVASRWSMEQDGQGRPLATLETNNDISERKQAEEEIRELNAELERRVIERTDELKASNKELEAFAYSISHDLRAPLRHVAGYSELLQKNAVSVLDEKSRRYEMMILESAQKMGDLIDDQNTLVSVGEIVNDVIKEVGREADGRDIVWKIGALPSLHGDRSMLRLALVNLLSNAVKFTRTRRQAEIEMACVGGNKDEIVVFVRDNGVGFDMKYVNKLFGVFQRLHLPEAFEGTGIGLATVQRIVARHGGRVWAEGVVDGGATFYLAFPNTHTG